MGVIGYVVGIDVLDTEYVTDWLNWLLGDIVLIDEDEIDFIPE